MKKWVMENKLNIKEYLDKDEQQRLDMERLRKYRIQQE